MGELMTTNTLASMQQMAMQKQVEVEKLGSDWKRKVEEMHSIIALVKGWQKKVFDKFGNPKVFAEGDERLWKVMEAGELAPLEKVAMDRVKFKGATIVQGLTVDWGVDEKRQRGTMPAGMTYHSPTVMINYQATLMTDENYFLRKMLPKTVEIPVHDPAYTLFDLQIEVPRTELVKESIFQLGEIVDGKVKEPRVKHSLKKAGRMLAKRADIFGWTIWLSLGWYVSSIVGDFWWITAFIWSLASLAAAKLMYEI
jgi:hypothetical protein